MTELQIENISKLISDLKDFEDSVIRQIGFSKNPNLEIEYLEDEVIILNKGVEQIRVKNRVLNGLISELKQQQKLSTDSKKKLIRHLN